MHCGLRVVVQRRLARGIPLILLVGAVTGCGSDDPMTGVVVWNYTATTVTVAYMRDGQTVALSRPIDPNGAASFGDYRNGACSPAPLLALDPAGNVVARRDAPLCPSTDERWVIGTRPSASP